MAGAALEETAPAEALPHGLCPGGVEAAGPVVTLLHLLDEGGAGGRALVHGGLVALAALDDVTLVTSGAHQEHILVDHLVVVQVVISRVSRWVPSVEKSISATLTNISVKKDFSDSSIFTPKAF